MRILFVCAGNACRSVMAEALARRAFDRRAGGSAFVVGSAGVRAVAGHPADPHAVAAVAALGADASASLSRPLTPDLLAESDLVLAATVRQRDRAVALAPARSRQTFTLLEFARIAAHIPPPRAPSSDVDEHGLAVVRAVASLRGRVPYVDVAALDIRDPARRSGAMRLCARSIAEAVDVCVAVLAPATAIGLTAAVRPADSVSVVRVREPST